jgi:hypothetical protein
MIFQGIALSELTTEEVLFFIRIRGKKSYFSQVYTPALLDLFKSLESFRCISEYKRDADVHINLNAVERDYLTQDELKIYNELIDTEDVIKRCRGLRAIPYSESTKLINRAFLFFYKFYSENKTLKLIVTGTVDNYVMDIMHKLGQFFDVKLLGVTGVFLHEYRLMTIRGEISCLNPPAEAELERVYCNIERGVKSSMTPKRSKAILSALYDLSSYYYRILVRFLFFYKIQKKLAYEYRFAPFMGKFNSINQLFAIRYLKKTIRFKEMDKKIAYVPLHYYPEATIDYWIENHMEYELSVIQTVIELQKRGFNVLVKEHPAFYLSRKKHFYQKMIELGVSLLSPFILTKQILNKIDLVVVWNGSSGIEAMVSNKPVVRVTNCYYDDGSIPHLEDVTEFELPVGVARNVVKKVLSSSYRAF